MSRASQQTATVLDAVAESLRRHLQTGQTVCVAFSGGLDSTVLLHAVNKLAPAALRALHIDHGLQPQSAQWAEQCQAVCANLAIACVVRRVQVDLHAGDGLEAAARAARYAAFAAELHADEVLLTAHHQQDQMETLLLQLFRGAGVHGLAAMPEYRQNYGSALLRPMLGLSLQSLRDYAAAEGLHWIEDPTNAQLDMDRNFLRHQVLPQIAERWPAAVASVSRSAGLCADAARVLDDLAAQDTADRVGNRIGLDSLGALPVERQRNALRYTLRLLGLPVPSAQQLNQALQLLLHARADAQPLISWPGVRIRRYRNSAWLYPAAADPGRAADPQSYRWAADTSLDLGSLRGKLLLESVSGRGIAANFCNDTLQVRFREGGEELRPGPKSSTRSLKNLLQESDIVPWMRGHIPLIYAADQLLAVGDIWVNADFAAAPGESGRAILWTQHPPLR